MAQIDERLLREFNEKPSRKVAVVLTVDDRFDLSEAKSLGLKEIQANQLYSGKLPGKTIVSLSQQPGVLAIEPDFDVSAT